MRPYNRKHKPVFTSAVKLSLKEAVKVSTLTGRKADVILIDEGLGNRVNLNYYGPECIAAGPAIFEGASCFVDHPSMSETVDRPERSVWHKAGYYSNVRVETIEGKNSLRAVLNLDETEAGEMVLEKISAAIEFKASNPGSDHEYVGLSINAQGETEKRTVTVNGEQIEANYVLNFVKDPFTSVDIVTAPARGGRFLALLESISGAKKNTQEAEMNKLKALIAKLNEAASVKTPEELKVKMAGIVKEAEEIEAEEKKEDESEESEAFKTLKAEHEALLKKHEDIGGMVKDLHKALHGEEPKADAKPAESEEEDGEDEEMEKCEAEKREKLLDLMLKEANIPAEVIEDKTKLAAKPMKAIEAEIARQKKVLELRTGSVKTSEADKPANMTDRFSKLSKI